MNPCADRRRAVSVVAWGQPLGQFTAFRSFHTRQAVSAKRRAIAVKKEEDCRKGAAASNVGAIGQCLLQGRRRSGLAVVTTESWW